MINNPYAPIFELTRGDTVESIHCGAVAVVDVHGNLLASFGDPNAVTFLRSTAKPFQALPFITHGGKEYFGLTDKEVALICASHSGTDEHVAVVKSIQEKAGVSESDLLCGVHPPMDQETAKAMQARGEEPTPNRHNCSGKHTGMLSFVRMKEQQGETMPPGLDYIDPSHPIQVEIRRTFAEMCGLPVNEVHLGTDGCSAPNFAVPLRNAAYAYARLSDPVNGSVSPPEKARACRTITNAMMTNPDMVGGPGRFDTRLMTITGGSLVSKGGAEGYQGIGIMPGVLGKDSPGIGIALKISDGDARRKVVPAVALEVLRQLGVLSEEELGALSDFGPSFPVENWRKLKVGEAYPVFTLEKEQ